MCHLKLWYSFRFSIYLKLKMNTLYIVSLQIYYCCFNHVEDLSARIPKTSLERLGRWSWIRRWRCCEDGAGRGSQLHTAEHWRLSPGGGQAGPHQRPEQQPAPVWAEASQMWGSSGNTEEETNERYILIQKTLKIYIYKFQNTSDQKIWGSRWLWIL